MEKLGFKVVFACLTILSGFICVFAYYPTVTLTETEPVAVRGVIYAQRDLDVTMNCYVENTAAKVIWQKLYYDDLGKLQATPITQDTGIEDNTKFGLEKPSDYTWKLRIKYVQTWDEGMYRCYVMATRINEVAVSVNLSVYIQPLLDPERTSSDMVAKEGDRVELTCNATGRPQPSIQWSRLGSQLLPTGEEIRRDPLLVIPSVQYADRGFYHCQASNTFGVDFIDLRLDVRFKPVITAPDVVQQALGYRVDLQCDIQANPFPSDVQVAWVKGTTTYTVSVAGRYEVRQSIGAFNRMIYELIIHGVRADDFGQYRCQITNALGNSFSQITLQQTNVPQPSSKLGRVINSAPLHILSTMLFMILVTVLHFL